MMILDIIYLAIIVVVSYFTFFNLVLWFESKDTIKKRKKVRGVSPTVSILIPAYNEEGIIESNIKNTLKINYPKNKLEIIVIDDGSTDKTYEIAKKYESVRLKVFKKRNTGKASTLNYGLKRAKNEFVAVVDADAFLEKNALKNCMKYFDEDEVAAVTSHILVKRKTTLFEKIQHIEYMIIALLRKLSEKLNLIYVTPGPLSVYRRKVLVKLGGFDKENLVEDVEIAWRILRNGYKIKMAFDAMVYSLYPSSLTKWWKQRTRWSIGGFQTFSKHFDSLWDKDSHNVKTVLIPSSIISYLFVAIGIATFLYLSLSWFVNNALYGIKSISAGISPFKFDTLYSASMYTVFGVIVILTSFWILKITLKTHREKPNILNLLSFLIIYMVLLPSVFVYSVYKFIRRERGWLTK